MTKAFHLRSKQIWHLGRILGMRPSWILPCWDMIHSMIFVRHTWKIWRSFATAGNVGSFCCCFLILIFRLNFKLIILWLLNASVLTWHAIILLGAYSLCGTLVLVKSSSIFGQPFVKRFALCYQTVVLYVCKVGVLCQNSWMDQGETWHGSRPRPRPHCVRWDPALPSKRGTVTQFSAHDSCGQTAGWIKMPLGTEVGHCPGDIVCIRWSSSFP